jgi:hypothetical protein
MIHAYNPSTQEAETRGLPVRGQSGIHRKFMASLGYIVKICLKKLRYLFS